MVIFVGRIIGEFCDSDVCKCASDNPVLSISRSYHDYEKASADHEKKPIGSITARLVQSCSRVFRHGRELPGDAEATNGSSISASEKPRLAAEEDLNK
ncbi:unnamed protein product, partial [Mesorhabditis spiculigera]